ALPIYEWRELNPARDKGALVLEGRRARPVLERDRPDGPAPEPHLGDRRHALLAPLPGASGLVSRGAAAAGAWMACPLSLAAPELQHRDRALRQIRDQVLQALD